MFCKYCGKQVPDDINFCNFCGGDLRGGARPVQSAPKNPTPQVVYTYENLPQGSNGGKKRNSGKGALITVLVLVLVLLAGVGGFFGYEKYMDYKEDSDSKIEADKDTDSSKKSSKTKDKDKEKDKDKNDDKDSSKKKKEGSSKKEKKDLDIKTGSEITKGRKDMTGKTLWFSRDGETRASSYWEFLDKDTARLVNSDGSYYEGEYVVMEGEAGMKYTEIAFPEYSVTYDELKTTLEANKKTYSDCMDYVILSFNNMYEYDVYGEQLSDEPSEKTFYYGATYDEDGYYLYEIVGCNTAEYYYFIDYDYDYGY